MAKTDDLDLGVEQASGPSKKLIIIVAGVVLLLIGAGVAAFFLLGGAAEEEPEEAAQVAANDAADSPAGPPIYYALAPVFVANLEGRPRLLQVGLQVRAYNPQLPEFLKHNDPMIRDRLLSLLSGQKGTVLKTRAGKEQLQTDLRTELQKIVDKYQGPGDIDAVFFSSFVMQ